VLFNSFDFALFFLIVWPIQRILPHRPRNVFLLLASCCFYAYWDWRFLLLLWSTILMDFAIGRGLETVESPIGRKSLVAVSVIFNLGLLAFFKYGNLLATSLVQLVQSLGGNVSSWDWQIILPLGISFHTFQSLSYVVDVYRRKTPAIRNLIDYGLYVTFFPQMVAGPIERGAHLAPQILHKPIMTWAHYSDGTWLILKGLFKKAVIADNLAPIVDRIFALENPTGPEVLLGVYAFAFQIYGDFAGYTDMARGIAKWLGYDLMLNFRLPYFAIDPSDFWQRWHISLSSWLRDYLYIPLGGNRGGLAMTCRNLMVTMALGGFWHGANWTFLIWGLFHGTILVAYRILQEYRPTGDAVRPAAGSLRWCLQVTVMFHLVCLGWLFFRAETLPQAMGMLSALGTNWTITTDLPQEVWQAAVLCLPLVMAQFLAESSGDLNALRRLSLLPRSIVYAAVILAVLSVGNFGGRDFIYFQF
jgi:alginate O-acetyltransferase complex protein AlgI